MRALVVSNMRPSADRPGRGVFVRDQVAALSTVAGVEVELVEGATGPRGLVALARELRRRRGFDVVHAHFGLTAWPALATPGAHRAVTLHGTDLRHPRSRRITLAALPRMDLVAAVSAALAAEVPPGRTRRPVEVLPCGVSLERFRVLARAGAREKLGLDRDEPFALFPADPARPEKRVDRARAAVGDARLVTLGDAAPEQMPLWINAANAVLVPSEREGFGLAVLEALACDVPVLATPVGVHAEALAGVAGTLCAPWDEELWREALRPRLEARDPRVEGRARVVPFGAEAMAQRVVEAWRAMCGATEDARAPF